MIIDVDLVVGNGPCTLANRDAGHDVHYELATELAVKGNFPQPVVSWRMRLVGAAGTRRSLAIRFDGMPPLGKLSSRVQPTEEQRRETEVFEAFVG